MPHFPFICLHYAHSVIRWWWERNGSRQASKLGISFICRCCSSITFWDSRTSQQPEGDRTKDLSTGELFFASFLSSRRRIHKCKETVIWYGWVDGWMDRSHYWFLFAVTVHFCLSSSVQSLIVVTRQGRTICNLHTYFNPPSYRHHRNKMHNSRLFVTDLRPILPSSLAAAGWSCHPNYLIPSSQLIMRINSGSHNHTGSRLTVNCCTLTL